MTLIGPGAGGYPTATAIFNDLLAIEKKERYAEGTMTAEITRIRAQ